VKDLIRDAYSLDDYQVVGGSAWTSSARFDVEGKSAGSREQMLLMLQTLLAERFKFTAHRASKELAVYALVPRHRSRREAHAGLTLSRSAIS